MLHRPWRWLAAGVLLAFAFAGLAALVPSGRPAAVPVLAQAVAGWTRPDRHGSVVLGQVPPPPALTAAAAILMDWETGQVLYEKRAYVRRAPASTTKVLTALVALERGHLDDRVTVSDRAARTGGSSMSIRAGETYTLRDLLYGLLLNSGNDAAVAIAEHISGSVAEFANLMNRRARELGARSTHFANPHGLNHPNHYSTAYDLAILTRHALRHPVFAEIVRQRHAEVLIGERNLALHNTNKLLWLYEGAADGVKTGTTSAAGACLISSATRGDPALALDQKLVAVVLDADGRWHDSIRLLEWGFTHYQLQQIARTGEAVVRLPVAGGREPWVPVAAGTTLAAVVPRDQAGERPALELLLPRRVAAPVAAGQPLGTARVRYGDQTQSTVPLVAGAAVAEATWATYLVRSLAPWLHRLARWAPW